MGSFSFITYTLIDFLNSSGVMRNRCSAVALIPDATRRAYGSGDDDKRESTSTNISSAFGKALSRLGRPALNYERVY
jgi:hypothetical protein